jgi:hypothetical protein
MKTISRQQFETALDAGNVEVLALNGKWYRARRNGKTKVWHTRNDWEVPIKFGFSACSRVDNRNINCGDIRIIADEMADFDRDMQADEAAE